MTALPSSLKKPFSLSLRVPRTLETQVSPGTDGRAETTRRTTYCPAVSAKLYATRDELAPRVSPSVSRSSCVMNPVRGMKIATALCGHRVGAGGRAP